MKENKVIKSSVGIGMGIGIILILIIMWGGISGFTEQKKLKYEEYIQNSISRSISYLFLDNTKLEKDEKYQINSFIRRSLGILEPYENEKEKNQYNNFLNRLTENYFLNVPSEKKELFIKKYQNKMISEVDTEYTIKFKELCEDIYKLVT